MGKVEAGFKKTIHRKCLVCGSKLRITLYKDRHCKGAYYYGKLNIPIGKGKHVKTGTFKLGRKKCDVTKWTGKHKQLEYWECEKCYSEGNFESALEEKLEKLYGKKCKDFEPSCIVCQAWDIYDTIIKDNRGEL